MHVSCLSRGAKHVGRNEVSHYIGAGPSTSSPAKKTPVLERTSTDGITTRDVSDTTREQVSEELPLGEYV